LSLFSRGGLSLEEEVEKLPQPSARVSQRLVESERRLSEAKVEGGPFDASCDPEHPMAPCRNAISHAINELASQASRLSRRNSLAYAQWRALPSQAIGKSFAALPEARRLRSHDEFRVDLLKGKPLFGHGFLDDVMEFGRPHDHDIRPAPIAGIGLYPC